MFDALEQTASMQAGDGPVRSTPAKPAVLSEDAQVQQNERSMRELQQIMGGLGS